MIVCVMNPPGNGPRLSCVLRQKATSWGANVALASRNVVSAFNSCAVVVLGPSTGCCPSEGSLIHIRDCTFIIVRHDLLNFGFQNILLRRRFWGYPPAGEHHSSFFRRSIVAATVIRKRMQYLVLFTVREVDCSVEERGERFFCYRHFVELNAALSEKSLYS